MHPEKRALKLKNYIVSRWYDTYHMLQYLCEVQETIEAAFVVLHNPVGRFSVIDHKFSESGRSFLDSDHSEWKQRMLAGYCSTVDTSFICLCHIIGAITAVSDSNWTDSTLSDQASQRLYSSIFRVCLLIF